MGIDLSYRATGVALINMVGNETSIDGVSCLENKEVGSVGFNSLMLASERFLYTKSVLKGIIRDIKPDAIIIEVPCFTQNAKSAIVIGMCWMVAAILDGDDTILVEPSALKKWSGSRKGDKKKLVKEKVIERVTLSPAQANNDNIVDALGLTMMFSDLISKQRYENSSDQ